MALIGFDKDSVVDFVPEYSGNRDSENPCIISLKFVPYSKVQEYSRLLAAKNKDVRDLAKLNEHAQFVQKKQFCESVQSIKNYFIGEKEIVSAEEFYNVADTDLIIEIIKATESQAKLSAGQKKI